MPDVSSFFLPSIEVHKANYTSCVWRGKQDTNLNVLFRFLKVSLEVSKLLLQISSPFLGSFQNGVLLLDVLHSTHPLLSASGQKLTQVGPFLNSNVKPLPW